MTYEKDTLAAGFLLILTGCPLTPPPNIDPSEPPPWWFGSIEQTKEIV